MRKNAPAYLYIMVVAKKVMTLLQILLLVFEREGQKGRRRREGVNEEVEGKGEWEKNGGKRKWEKREGKGRGMAGWEKMRRIGGEEWEDKGSGWEKGEGKGGG